MWPIAQIDPERLIDPRNVTVVGLLLLIVLAFLKGWMIPVILLTRERQLQEAQLAAEKERTKQERDRGDKWEAIALRQLEALKSAQDVARGGQDIARETLEVVKSNSDKQR